MFPHRHQKKRGSTKRYRAAKPAEIRTKTHSCNAYRQSARAKALHSQAHSHLHKKEKGSTHTHRAARPTENQPESSPCILKHTATHTKGEKMNTQKRKDANHTESQPAPGPCTPTHTATHTQEGREGAHRGTKLQGPPTFSQSPALAFPSTQPPTQKETRAHTEGQSCKAPRESARA